MNSIQMSGAENLEKAFTPVAILLISALFNLQHLNQQLVMIVIVRPSNLTLS
jgi:hypothetical protein